MVNNPCFTSLRKLPLQWNCDESLELFYSPEFRNIHKIPREVQGIFASGGRVGGGGGFSKEIGDLVLGTVYRHVSRQWLSINSGIEETDKSVEYLTDVFQVSFLDHVGDVKIPIVTDNRTLGLFSSETSSMQWILSKSHTFEGRCPARF